LTQVCGKPDGDTFFLLYENQFAAVETLRETPEFKIVRYVRKSPSS